MSTSFAASEGGLMYKVTALSLPMQSKILVEDTGCWGWQGAVQSSGYGSVSNGQGGSMLAHRRAYQELVGEIAVGMTIDHLCENKLCMNPAHMEQVTRGENTLRKLAKQTHCKFGHPFEGDNVRFQERDNGLIYRVCRACARRHNANTRARRAA